MQCNRLILVPGVRPIMQALHVIFFLGLFTVPAWAQDTVLNGLVLELGSGEPLYHVEIKNLNTGVSTESGEDGSFSIATTKNQRLQFEYPGYRTDTLVVIEFGIKRVYLTPDGSTIQLDEVQIQAMTDSRLEAEIKRAQEEGKFTDVSQHRGGLRISPSRWFGSAGRQARQRYQLLLAERERRQIDARFTRRAITAVTPLEGEDLELYMTKYRPSAEFLSTADESDLRLYIMDTYAAFKALTPEERAEIKVPARGADSSNDQ
ncbi:MAG TPA: hypothetical protein VNQ80_17620 [Parapedobacter sp.]|uniref:hypothetical protein n=1 Tax=Parapedobacter sp. TaxID=1958893 RepID=UPI002C97E6B0|nr:hypothetical protein [Parapedobacter sp.]HWK59166.1 hypothetical protein [Parapedobacter sp.]